MKAEEEQGKRERERRHCASFHFVLEEERLTMDADYEEDVDLNPFYVALRDNFPELFGQVERESLFVCVPQLAAISDDPADTFTQDLMGT